MRPRQYGNNVIDLAAIVGIKTFYGYGKNGKNVLLLGGHIMFVPLPYVKALYNDLGLEYKEPEE